VPSPLRDDVTLLGDALMTAGATIRRAGGTMIGGAMILRDGAMILRDGAMMIGGAMFHHAKFPIVSVVTLRQCFAASARAGIHWIFLSKHHAIPAARTVRGVMLQGEANAM